MKKLFSINEDFDNSRLDRWFRKIICNVPQSLIEKNIRKGNIKVNNKKVKSSYKLHTKDQIILRNIFFKPNINKIKQNYIPTKKEIISSTGIFIENNENFAVINKPSGISVQSGTKSKRNILDILRKTNEFKGNMPYTVHRIDKDTSGLLIVAKNRKYAQLFTSLFRIRKIHKIYLGVVIGQPKNMKGKFIDELFHYEGEKKIKTNAITHYQVLDAKGNYSLLKLSPETGRKHQIRKQLLIHGHPILGDAKYRITENKFKRDSVLMLHAYKINFSISENKYKFLAEPPSTFMKILKEKFLKIPL